MIVSIPFSKQKVSIEKSFIAIGIVWLFQLSAIVGISLGFHDWFLSKTPLTLILHLLLVLWLFPFQNSSFRLASASIVLIGFLAEWAGVNHFPIFGMYEYGDNFGMKIQGTPLLIGFNWFVLAIVSNVIAKKLLQKKSLQILLGAILMVFLDLFMEVVAGPFDYWHFVDGMPPLENYLSWFVLGLLMNFILRPFKINQQFGFSIHLYLANLLFFGYFALVN